jgi:hypothetical protein
MIEFNIIRGKLIRGREYHDEDGSITHDILYGKLATMGRPGRFPIDRRFDRAVVVGLHEERGAIKNDVK